MRETQKITLPVSGIVAEVVTFYTYAELKKIERELYKAAKSVRMVDGVQQTEIDGSAVSDSTVMAMTIAVRKLTAPDGTDIPVTRETIDDMHAKDGMAIEAAINKIDSDMQKK